MFTGRRVFPSDPGVAGAPLWRRLLGVVLAGALTWALMKGLRC
jgi:hypothetical protein